jgi:hypothetical protein
MRVVKGWVMDNRKCNDGGQLLISDINTLIKRHVRWLEQF